MRSPAEIAFRLRQELANLYLWKFPPSLARMPGLPRLQDPDAAIARLRGTPFAREVVRLADEIAAHRFPIFGGVLDTGPEICWRRDYAHGIETGTPYFRRIPYLDFGRVGDHKYVWELNRHQHFVLLAQAFRFTGERGYLEEALRQFESWLAANPFLRGINWTSALEAAFRALSWVWLDHLCGTAMPEAFRRRLLNALYQHGRFLEENLSIYFSPNTHLLGEAVALHTFGVVYPDLPRSARWQARGHELVEEQMERQVRDDGTHFEQSTYYHVYALDLFLWHDLLADTSPSYRKKLSRMAEYLNAVLGPAGRIPFIGDDDGGRVFHPYGDRDAFGRATLATCGVRFQKPAWIRSTGDLAEQAAWWIAPETLDAIPTSRDTPSSRLFPQAGVATLASGDVQIVIKAGGFGVSTAGHSHSDALSFTCRRGDAEILIDPGTFTYLADPEWRNLFRCSGAHNTIRIDGKDQAVPSGPFRWEGRPETRIREWASTPERDLLDAECRYSGFVHRRRFLFLKPDLLLILDQIEGPTGEHRIEQFWHAGGPQAWNAIALSGSTTEMASWRSKVFGEKEPSSTRCVLHAGSLPAVLAGAVSFASDLAGLKLMTVQPHPCLKVRFSDGRTREVTLG